MFRSSAYFFVFLSYELFVYFGNSPLVASVATIFSQSIGCLFILFMVSFAVQKIVSLTRSHLFIFAFISVAKLRS